jgi:hypothetical protein
MGATTRAEARFQSSGAVEPNDKEDERNYADDAQCAQLAIRIIAASHDEQN